MAVRFYSPVRKARRPSPTSLEALADRMSGAIRISFADGITRFGARVNHDSMEKALRSGNYKAVVATVPWDKLPEDLAAFEASIGRAASAGSKFGGDEVQRGLGGRGSMPRAGGSGRRLSPDAAKNLSLGPKNPAIQAYLRGRTGELVQNVTDNLQKNIQTAVRQARAAYASPRQIADRLIAQKLPLNDRQAAALDRFSASAMEALPPRAAEKSIDRYASQLQDQRAMMIARTEASFATSYGQQQVWQTARDEGLIPEGALKEWVTEADPCVICLALSGQQVPIDEMWQSDDGPIDIPAHPACRCVSALVSEKL